MNCEELRDHYELYAMGVADEPERAEIGAHLGRGCEVCMTGMKRARALSAMLGGMAGPAEPSKKLRSRILASIGFEERHFAWTPLWAAVAALSLVTAVYFAGREKDAARQANELRSQMQRQDIELARLNEAFAILSGPDTTVTTFGTGRPQPPKGKVFVNPSQGVLLVASNLPPAGTGKVYEMWLIPKGDKPTPRPAGLFQSGSDGTALHIQRGAVDLANVAAVAVTLENEGGAAEPTSQPLIVAALQ
jgi:anti-sigma-K factor RskA